MWGLFVYSWNSGSMLCFIILRDLRVLRGQRVFSSEKLEVLSIHEAFYDKIKAKGGRVSLKF